MIEHSYGIIAVKRTGLEPQFMIIQHQAGHWGFPKGHALTGETAVETAKRELLEETGLRDSRIDDQASFSKQYRYMKDGHSVLKEVKYFLAFTEAEPRVKNNSEIKQARWAAVGEALDMITFQSTRDLLLQVKEYLRTHDQNQWT